MFDVYLPIVALGPAMSFFQPETLSPALQSTLFYVVFAFSLVGRPLGAVVFGHYSDKVGRRKTTIISMGGFAAVTLLIALLPGYQTWGIGSLAALTFLRFLDGIFLGGEYTGANPLAMEYAPKEKRGIWAAFIHSGFPLAVVAMSLITGGLLRVLPAGSLHSPYVQWGWRIPFLVGAVLAGAVCYYCVKKVPESKVWDHARHTGSPLKEVLHGDHLRCLAQVFVTLSGAWFTLNAVTSVLPGVLLNVRTVSSAIVNNAQLITHLLLFPVFILVGMLGQRIGRRSTLAVIGVAGCTAGPALYYVLVQLGLPEPGRADRARRPHQPLCNASVGGRDVIHQRAVSDRRARIRLRARVQCSHDHPRVYITVHARLECARISLRVHADRFPRVGRPPVARWRTLRAGDKTRRYRVTSPLLRGHGNAQALLWRDHVLAPR